MKKTRAELCVQFAARGYEHIQAGEFDAALELAKRLREMRYTASFEIEALAHAGKGRLERAVDVLEEGVGFVPTVWLNWSLLANYRSDLGRFSEAEEAYLSALECPAVDTNVVQLNRAILANRIGDHKKAEKLLKEVTDPQHARRVAGARVAALVGLGHEEQAEMLAIELLDAGLETSPITAEQDEEVDPPEGWLAAEVAQIRLRRGADREEVRDFLADSLDGTRGHSAQLALIREIDGERSIDAKYYRVLLHATAREGEDLPDGFAGYYSSIDVVADSPEEAAAYIQNVHVIEPYTQWSIEGCEVIEARPNDLKGVYRLEGCTWYAVDSDE